MFVSAREGGAKQGCPSSGAGSFALFGLQRRSCSTSKRVDGGGAHTGTGAQTTVCATCQSSLRKEKGEKAWADPSRPMGVASVGFFPHRSREGRRRGIGGARKVVPESRRFNETWKKKEKQLRTKQSFTCRTHVYSNSSRNNRKHCRIFYFQSFGVVLMLAPCPALPARAPVCKRGGVRNSSAWRRFDRERD